MRLEDKNGVVLANWDNQALLLGRAHHADVRFENDLGCSREQARVYQQNNQFLLEALSQNTPVFVNGQQVEGVIVLPEGAEISFSEQTVYFRNTAPGISGVDQNAPASHDGDMVIGRSATAADLTIDHPTVSRRHAIFSAAEAVVRDLGSTNGTFVNGERISAPRALHNGDRVDIGPFALFYDGAQLSMRSRQGNASIRGNNLCVDVRTSNRGLLRILDNVSIEIAPCEFVCIVGPSGSGKSTLMKALSGRMPATSGSVKFGDLDLVANFESLKQEIAFVPQHDVLHESLTLERALTYTAQLRLPKDTTAENHRSLVQAAAADVELTERLTNKIATLSGGQKKRASLASETLAKPGLLFLDEVTSGLDEATDREIMNLLRQKADAGMTIVCVTHTLANVEEFCDRLIVMAEGGVVAYDGPPNGALADFTVSRLGQVFDRLKEHPLEYWRARVGNAQGTPPTPSAPGRKRSASGGRLNIGRSLRQFLILTRRNIDLVLADKRGFAMAVAQSIVIGVLVGYAFSDFGVGFEVVNSQSALMLLLGLCSIWLGCNAASQEIVGERQIFLREHDVNLSAIAFVLSKFLISGLFSALQFVVVFSLVAVFAAEIPGPTGVQLGYLLLGSVAGTGMGILLSSLANTNEQATTIVPLTLVPQLIFAGVLVPKLPEFATYFAEIAVSGYWLTEGMKSNLINHKGPIEVVDVATGQAVEMTAASAETGSLVILLHIVTFLALTAITVIKRAER